MAADFFLEEANQASLHGLTGSFRDTTSCKAISAANIPPNTVGSVLFCSVSAVDKF